MELNIEKVKRKMRIKGWTQARLAAEMGVTRQWVNIMIKRKDQGNYMLDTVSRLAEVLEAKPKNLLTD